MPTKAKAPAKSTARQPRQATPRSASRPKRASGATATLRRAKPTAKPTAPSPLAAAVATKPTKQAQLIALLRPSTGTSIEQMTSATGWQPHTVRGVISRVLRKRLGLNVACSSPDETGVRTYRIVDAA